MSDTKEQDNVVEVKPDDSVSKYEPDERDEQAQSYHPWPYLKEMFTLVGSKKDSWRMNCVLCRPKVRELLAYKNSPSNLKKHIERKHKNHMEKYLKLTSIKRKSSEPEEGQGPAAKQVKLWETKKVSQKSVDDAIISFVIQGLQPLSVVEQPGFKDLVQHLQPGVSVICRGTVKNRVVKATQDMKKNLKAAMSKVQFIATTTDCWTAHRRSFLGVTAHWLDPLTMRRCSAALACCQLEGSHTFAVLAGALNNIHTEYNIRAKVVCTTTDNGSNFIKAFKVYGHDENNNTGGPLQGASQTREESSDEEEGEPVEIVDAGGILDEDDGLEYQLPKHHRCACHLLNLVATVDLSAADADPVYKRVSRSAFAKCHSLWNKTSRSTQAAEIIAKKCKLQLVRPVETRWNSLFFAVERLGRIINEQGEEAIASVCSALKIPMLTQAEIAFLREYAKTMKPVAKAVNILQGEANVQMGWLVPTITLLKAKLEQFHISSKYCGPLLDALQAGLEKRFGQMLGDPELIAAAILVPKFRTTWTCNEEILKSGLDYIKSHLKDQPTVHSGNTPQSSDEDDFFSTIKKGKAHENTKELESYLANPDDDMDVLKSYPAVCHLSLMLNTPLPASAACERLFSTAGLILHPKRARIGSENFENQLLLKLNKPFW
ncbi:uncharacterized protein LOC121646934 isoform X2 [Melanotaenia boesemani]|uniref:uncharacterized protein LOC121646934 isoform X2 n=1 Tax=Melanotaenia boesemani TaxID=1250792 RepID=UPI001C04F1AD|nr:uncharacterized protein LOC121646934 isoform X2 [Melanotaenia boesemani]